MDEVEAYSSAYQDMTNEIARYPHVADDPYPFAFGTIAGRMRYRETWDRDALDASLRGLKDAISDARKAQRLAEQATITTDTEGASQ